MQPDGGNGNMKTITVNTMKHANPATRKPSLDKHALLDTCDRKGRPYINITEGIL